MGKRWFNSSHKKHLSIYCPFGKSCLYLDGESPEKALGERNYLQTRVDALEGAVDFATEQVIELRKRNEELEREKKNIQKELVRALRAPFKRYEVKEIPENPQKRGLPFGHPGYFRKSSEGIDEYVDVRFDKCPYCGNAALSTCSHTTEHLHEDIESGKLRATCFIHYFFWCSVCNKAIHAWGANEIPNTYTSPDARAKTSFLRYEIKPSYDDVQRVLHHMCGLPVVPGSIVGFDNRAEQGLRNSVIFWCLIFGTRSEQGKKNVSLIINVIRSAKLKSLNTIKTLKKISLNGTAPQLLKMFGIPAVMPQAP